jgi:hypothetical protein
MTVFFGNDFLSLSLLGLLFVHIGQSNCCTRQAGEPSVTVRIRSGRVQYRAGATIVLALSFISCDRFKQFCWITSVRSCGLCFRVHEAKNHRRTPISFGIVDRRK